MDRDTAPPLLSLRRIGLSFGAVRALVDVDLDVRGGEVHALLGENGAGKSTLMNVLYGLLRPDRGEIAWRGERCHLSSPRAARRLGIGMVHQEFALIDALSVADNLALSLGDAGDWLLRRAVIRDRAKALAGEIGLELAPLDTPVGHLPVGARQRIEILKALAGDPRLLILDEPTAVLTPDEVEPLFAVLRRLRARGVAIVFITHKLAEVMAVADRMTVMRSGRVVGEARHGTTSAEALAALMVGDPAARQLPAPRRVADDAPPRLEVAALEVRAGAGAPLLDRVALQVRAGELVGIAGVDGNGQSELFEILCGLRAPSGGEIRVEGRSFDRLETGAGADIGIAAIPPDRRQAGAIVEMAVWENAILSRPLLRRAASGPFLRGAVGREIARSFVERYAIVCDGVDAPAGSLSGGNLQRLIVARSLARDPRVLVAFNPTRGLDISAARAVYDAFADAASRGTAILLISTDLDELLATSDRIGVLYRGRLSDLLAPPFDRARIGRLMAGADG